MIYRYDTLHVQARYIIDNTKRFLLHAVTSLSANLLYIEALYAYVHESYNLVWLFLG